jgi:PAS domain S-box-containing protein
MGANLMTSDRLRPEDLGFGRLFERIRDAVIVADAMTQRIILWNAAAAKMFGYSTSEALELRVEALVPEPLKAAHRAGIARYAETGHGPYIDSDALLDLPAVRKNDEEIYVELSLSPIGLDDDTNGGRRFVLAIVRDVTSRKQAELAIQHLNKELENRVAERTAQLADRERQLEELVSKLITAQEEERHWLAYEVHDSLIQMAVVTQRYIQTFADSHPPGSKVQAGELDRALEMARQTVQEGRRLVKGLRPTTLDDFGLATAVRQRVEELQNEGWEISYEETLGKERLPVEVEITLYRVTQEALNNVQRHARTTAACLTLTHWGRKVRLEVRDEGRGFDRSAVSGEQGPVERLGLSTMRERVALLGGELEIRSIPGAGTSIVAEVPLPATFEAGGTDREGR